jgi:hypothetical protein
MPKSKKTTYQVVVGNVGTVYDGANKRKAEKEFAAYVAISKTGNGRAGGEDVSLFEYYPNGESDMIAQHDGHLQVSEDI